MSEPNGERFLKSWDRLRSWPGGRALYSRLLGFAVPYTGTIRPRIVELRSGYAQVELKDRRRVRNHLRSVHAMALANIAELATGLALNFGMPGRGRGILIGFRMDYVKKARGTLTAECSCEVPPVDRDSDVEVAGEIRDAGGDVVARARATWRVGPRPSKAEEEHVCRAES